MSNPIKPSFKTEWFSLSLILLSLILAAYFYQNFPAVVPTHWGINGEANGFSGPLVAAILVPLMMIALYVIFLVMPYIDPRKDQYENFASIYHNFKDLIIAFLFALYLLTGLSGLGYKVDISFYLPIMVGVLFIVIGLLMRKVKMNWFVGVRTPWTMSSEAVWEKTNKFSSWVFGVSGLVMAATVLVGAQIKIILFVVSIAFMVFALPIYSYIIFIKEKNKK